MISETVFDVAYRRDPPARNTRQGENRLESEPKVAETENRRQSTEKPPVRSKDDAADARDGRRLRTDDTEHKTPRPLVRFKSRGAEESGPPFEIEPEAGVARHKAPPPGTFVDELA